MIELDVKNMTCGHCVRTVSGAVNAVDPAAVVEVDLKRGRMLVDGQSPAAELIDALQSAGYPSAVAGGMAPAATPKNGGCCCG
ncbi:MAG: heavy-metal-associated domain-containing protein [Rubrivivax sp.]